MNKLVWKLLRQHISIGQLSGFFLANIFGMLIVLLSVQFYKDVLPVFTQGDSFMKKDYIIATKKISIPKMLARKKPLNCPMLMCWRRSFQTSLFIEIIIYSFITLLYSNSICFPMEVTIIPAPCRSASSVSMRPISVPLSSSRWLIGSSRKMKSNGWQRARMKATRCCCPKDNFPAFSFTFSAIPSVSKSARISFFFL